MLMGVLFAGLAAASWGAGVIFVRMGLVHIHPTRGTLLSLLAGLALLFPLVMIFEGDDLLAVGSLPAVAFLWFALGGFLYFGIGRLLNYNSIRLAGASRSAPIVNIGPLVGVLLAVLFLGEDVTPLLFVGIMATFLGTVLVVTQR